MWANMAAPPIAKNYWHLEVSKWYAASVHITITWEKAECWGSGFSNE